MASETAQENAEALTLLDLQPDDQILEIGFGHGRTLARAAEMVSRGFLAGVDTSAEMLKVAAHRNRNLVARGKMELELGNSSAIPYPDERFDKVYAVHTIYFWPAPLQDLREIRRVLKANGCLVLGFRPRDQKAIAEFPSTVYRFYTADEVRLLLQESGFEQVRMVSGRFPNRPIMFAVARRTDKGPTVLK